MTNIKFYISGAFGATKKTLVPNGRGMSLPNSNWDLNPKKNQTELWSGFGIDENLGSVLVLGSGRALVCRLSILDIK
jgi:hypothetical protein